MVRNPVLEVMLLDNNEPTSYGEAMVGPDSDKWLEAMKSEIGSIYQNKVWTLVDLPDDRQAIEINGSLRRRQTWAVMLLSGGRCDICQWVAYHYGSQ